MVAIIAYDSIRKSNCAKSTNIINKSSNNISKDINNNKKGRKPLIERLSKEIFFALIYTLRAMAKCARYLLSIEKFSFILPRKLSNDSIKLYYYKNRYFSKIV